MSDHWLEVQRQEQLQTQQDMIFRLTNSLRDVTIQRNEARRLAEQYRDMALEPHNLPTLPWEVNK